MDAVERIRREALEAIETAAAPETLEQARVQFLGRKGSVTELLKSLKDLSLDERRTLGPLVQKLQRDLEAAIAARKELLSEVPTNVDLTAPGKRIRPGHLHPLSLMDEEVRKVFSTLNFSIVEGPEIESEHYNFDALNFPPEHPARDLQDTFWLEQSAARAKNPKTNLLLRTQMSAVQVHHLEAHEPPFQILYTGRTFRYEASDAGHESNFHQYEAMMVGKDITLANFKFVIETFLKKTLGSNVRFRYRPSYFPFVEPGLEVDVYFRGKWFEMLGAGMVHQHVFEYAGYNPGEWQGFAFGAGLDRLAMIKYNVPDLRLFFSGDIRVNQLQ